MKAKKVFDRIFKTIQILVDFAMAIAAIAVSVEALNRSSYMYVDWFAYFTYWIVGMVVFNGLFIYIRKIVKDY